MKITLIDIFFARSAIFFYFLPKLYCKKMYFESQNPFETPDLIDNVLTDLPGRHPQCN